MILHEPGCRLNVLQPHSPDFADRQRCKVDHYFLLAASQKDVDVRGRVVARVDDDSEAADAQNCAHPK